jgi:AcrR family transcriptional regulator
MANECLLECMIPVTGARAARKQQTRQALLDAALHLAQERGLSAVSLREVTRAAGVVPASFYRHFPDMESLGVALVQESLAPLHAALRAVRIGPTESGEIIRGSVAVLATQVREHPELFCFLARERLGGVLPVREAIRTQLRSFADELARDLREGQVDPAERLDAWPPSDVDMLASLLVNLMVLTAAGLLEEPDAEKAVLETATAQLSLIVLGARHWRDNA